MHWPALAVTVREPFPLFPLTLPVNSTLPPAYERPLAVNRPALSIVPENREPDPVVMVTSFRQPPGQ